MSRNVKSYFEIHAHNYSRSPEFYNSLIRHVKKIATDGHPTRVLDIGCGNGIFIKSLIDANLKAKVFGTDISFKMIETAKENLLGSDVELFIADSFKLPISPNFRFDIIHMDSVLHHLIGKSRRKSTILIKEMLQLLVDRLENNGTLIVEEIYYESHILRNFTSFIIFYGLKLINFLKLDIKILGQVIKPGLEVNFLAEKQLAKILSQYGSLFLLQKSPWRFSKVYKLFLLKEVGDITYIVNSNNT